MKAIYFVTLALISTVGHSLSLSAQTEEQFSGSLSLGGNLYLNGRRDSAQFEQYSDLPNGALTEMQLKYRDNQGFQSGFEGSGAGEQDQDILFSAGQAGRYRMELEHSEIPHNYAFGASSLYGGLGGDYLPFDPSLREELSSSTSMTELGTELTEAMPSAWKVDTGLGRSRERATLKLSEFDPFELSAEIKREEQQGTRPIGLAFGFGNVIEALEPRDYQTMEYSLIAEYANHDAYFSSGYYASVFESTYDSLIWENPFRLSDSTSPSAYTNPGGSGLAFANNGPSIGMTGAAPDNWYQSIALNSGLKNLPLDSRLSSTLSFGWAQANNPMLAYTTNSAINPATGAPFDASSVSSLPSTRVNAEVNSTLWNLALTSRPADYARTKIYYRLNRRDNRTREYEFPGYVRFDSVWEEIPLSSEGYSWNKHSTGADLDFEAAKNSDLGLGYRFEQTNRNHREADTSNDHALTLSAANSPSEHLKLRSSWEHSVRSISGEYDPSVPFDGEVPNASLPFLRKYDIADRTRDALNLMASFFPMETLDLSGSFLMARSDYSKSDFGLQDDTQLVYALDAVCNPAPRVELSAFYSYELHNASQQSRQWNPAGIGDPYSRDITITSNSNWSAKLNDDVQTAGAGLKFDLVPKVLTFKASYSLSYANGAVKMDSPVGTALVDDTNAFSPKNMYEAGDIVTQSFIPEFVWNIKKDLDVSLGYFWQRYNVSDYLKDGFSNVPLNAAGAYNGQLYMGTLPYSNYEVNLAFARFDYRF